MGKNMFVTRNVPHSSICLVTPISRERSLMKWADVASLCTLFPHLQMPFARWFKNKRSFQTRQLIKACRQLFHKNTFSSQTILHMVGNMNSLCCRTSGLSVVGRIFQVKWKYVLFSLLTVSFCSKLLLDAALSCLLAQVAGGQLGEDDDYCLLQLL